MQVVFATLLAKAKDLETLIQAGGLIGYVDDQVHAAVLIGKIESEHEQRAKQVVHEAFKIYIDGMETELSRPE